MFQFRLQLPSSTVRLGLGLGLGSSVEPLTINPWIDLFLVSTAASFVDGGSPLAHLVDHRLSPMHPSRRNSIASSAAASRPTSRRSVAEEVRYIYIYVYIYIHIYI